MGNTLGNWQVVAVLLAAGGAAASDASSAPRVPEPQLGQDVDAWQDAWWVDGTRALPAVPGQMAAGMDATKQRVKAQHQRGIMAGDTQLVVGVDEANTLLQQRLEAARRHGVSTVVDVAPHVRNAANAWVTHTKLSAEYAAAQHAASNAGWDDATARSAQVMDETGRGLRDSRAGAQQRTARAWERAAEWVPTNTSTRVEDARVEAGHNLANVRDDAGTRWRLMNHAQDVLTQDWAVWTAAQPAQGHAAMRAAVGDDLNAAVDDAAQQAMDLELAWIRAERSGARMVGEAATDASQRTHAHSQELLERGKEQQTWFAQRQQGLEAATVDRLEEVAAGHVAGTARDARALWRLGWQQYLQGGTQEAGDNIFAGDVEGVALGGFYLVASGAQGGGVLLVLEPLAAASNVTAGASHVTALGAGGVLGTGAIQGTRLVVTVGSASLGAATLLGLSTLLQAQVAGAALLAWGGLGWAATAGATRTVLAAGRGLTLAAVDGVGGVVGTATRTGFGATVTLAAATAGRALTHAAWASRSAWGVGVALGAGALAMGWPVLLHAGAASGAAVFGGAAALWAAAWVAGAHVVLPARAVALVTGGHVAAGAAGLARHVVVVPVVVAGHGLKASAQSAWALLEDPLASGFNLGAGVGGHAARMTAHGLGTAVTFGAGAGWTVAQGAGTVVHHSGRMVVASTAKMAEQVIAPFRFDLHARWAGARRPQLEAMLASQPEDVRGRVGTAIKYVRVTMVGEHRGSVAFFTVPTSGGGQQRFTRTVAKDCAVLFVGDGGITLDSGWADRGCEQERG